MTIDALDGIDVSYHVFINVFDFNIILIAFSLFPSQCGPWIYSTKFS